MSKCKTCGGWVNPLERIYTDEAMYNDRLSCLTEGSFEALVAKYACRCSEDEETPRVTAEQRREAIRVVTTLVPGEYDSDDLDRIAAEWDRR